MDGKDGEANLHDLLELLTRRTGAPYLSDLSLGGYANAIRSVVDTIPPGTYPLKQWTDAVRYVTGNYTLTPQSEFEARKLLREAARSLPL